MGIDLYRVVGSVNIAGQVIGFEHQDVDALVVSGRSDLLRI